VFIHFAFGGLGKQGKTEEQTKQVVDLILSKRQLLFSKCKEFIPEFPKRGSKIIPAELMRQTGELEVTASFDITDPNWMNRLPDDKTIHYLPFDIPMICFNKNSFSQLKRSTHHIIYGKFGLVFTEDFLKNNGIKPVLYYTETSLWIDPLIKRWNLENDKLSMTEKIQIERNITNFRKPARLFKSFNDSVTIIMSHSSQGSNIQYWTYNRYPENYDFTKENECRIVVNSGAEYLNFNEEDVFMVITPDLKAKEKIDSFFEDNWDTHPIVKLYPQ
jgi:hypothetical protein